MAETSNFYFLYDIKQESIPEEDEWALRYEKFVKHIPPSEDENVKYALPTEDESVKLSQFEENLAEQTLSNERNSIKRELWPF